MANLLAACAVTAALILGGGLARAAGADASAPLDAGAAGTGTLDLKSEPGDVEFFIDDDTHTGKTVVTGKTPVTVTLPAGQHQLKLVSPNASQYKDLSLTISIVAGKPTRLTLHLARVPAVK